MCPFDGSGNYALSDTIAPATNADANELQAILDDIATALDNCVAADGQSSMTGTLKLPDGDATAPALRFVSDTNSGFYRIGADNVGLSLGGTKRWDYGTAGATLTGTLTVSGAVTLQSTVSAVDTATLTSTDAGAGLGPVVDLYRDSATPAVNDLIGNILFNGRDSANNKQTYAQIYTQITDPISTTEDANLFIQAVVAGSMTTVLQNSGAGIQIPGTLQVTGTITGSHAAPTVQRLTSGTAATFTPTAGAVRWRIRMIGPGAGGGAAVTNNGTNGGSSAATSFQVNSTGTAWTASYGLGGVNGGGGGQTGGAGGTGGSNGSTGTLVHRMDGACGVSGGASATANTFISGGAGGSGPFGGSGRGAAGAAGAGQAAAANSGAGGGGGNSGSAGNAGGGGGAGEYVEFWVTGMTTATYTVPAGGAGGTAGTQAGGNGGSGVILVEEFYS